MRLVLLIALLSSRMMCEASVWYAAATGTDTNGTTANPWSIPFAFTNETLLSPGDTVLLHNGTFTCTIYSSTYDASNVILAARSGTVSNPITYQSETLWGFTFDGGIVVPYAVSNLVFRNLKISFSQTNRVRTNIWEYPCGFAVFGTNITLSHNLVENCGIGLFDGKLAANKKIFGNVFRFNGCNDWTPTYTGANRGGGIYTENSFGSAMLSGNICYGNYTEGILIAQELTGYCVTNNILVGGETAALLYETRSSSSPGVKITSNCMWNGFLSDGLQLGYIDPSSEGGTNGVIVGNYIVGGVKGLLVDNYWINVTVQTNTIVMRGLPGDGGSDYATEYNIFCLEPTAKPTSPTYSISGNSYFSGTNSVNNFRMWGTNLSFANWQTRSGDSGSAAYSTLPASNFVSIMQPPGDPDFSHVCIYNWVSNSTASVDLTACYVPGDLLSIYDAQNVPTSYTNLTYGGGSIDLDLSLTNRATMNGMFTSPSMPWQGFDPRFRAFVIYRTGKGNSSRLKATTAAAQRIIGR